MTVRIRELEHIDLFETRVRIMRACSKLDPVVFLYIFHSLQVSLMFVSSTRSSHSLLQFFFLRSLLQFLSHIPIFGSLSHIHLFTSPLTFSLTFVLLSFAHQVLVSNPFSVSLQILLLMPLLTCVSISRPSRYLRFPLFLTFTSASYPQPPQSQTQVILSFTSLSNSFAHAPAKLCHYIKILYIYTYPILPELSYILSPPRPPPPVTTTKHHQPLFTIYHSSVIYPFPILLETPLLIPLPTCPVRSFFTYDGSGMLPATDPLERRFEILGRFSSYYSSLQP